MASPADREVQAREDVDRIARHFHAHYEELAPQFGWVTRKDSAVPWDEVPAENRELMRAVVTRLLLADVIRIGQRPATVDQMFGQTSIDDDPPTD